MVGASVGVTLIGGKVAATVANPLYDKLSAKMKKDLVKQLGEKQIPQLDADPIADIFKKHVKNHGKISEKELNADVEKIIESLIPPTLQGKERKDFSALLNGEFKGVLFSFDYSSKRVKMTFADQGVIKVKPLPEGIKSVDDIEEAIQAIQNAKKNIKDGLAVAKTDPYKFLSVMATLGKCLATVAMTVGVCAMFVGAVPLGAAVLAGGLVLLGASCAATVVHAHKYCNGITDDQVKNLNGTIAETAKALQIAGKSQVESNAIGQAFGDDPQAVATVLASREALQSRPAHQK